MQNQEKLKINDSVVIYSSLWEAIELLPSLKKKYETIKAILDYGIYDIAPNPSCNEVKAIIVQALPNINSAKMKYKQSCDNGKYGSLGGRPEKISKEEVNELVKKGFTNRQIAEKLGCDISTVSRKLQNCKTLNDNSNEDNNGKDNCYEKIEYKINNNIKDNNYDEEKSKINNNIKNNYYSTDNISSGNINKPKTLGQKMEEMESDDRITVLILSCTHYCYW